MARVKPLLFAYSACLLSLICFGNWRRYRLASCFLGFALFAAALLNFPLPSWYPYLMAITALFRLLAGLEVLHRQTDNFYYWGRLNGASWLLAGMFTAVCWLMRAPAAGEMGEWVDVRRLSQIWLAFAFVAVEVIWWVAGGRLYRQVDLIAAAWGLMAANHAVSSVVAFSGRWNDWARWWDAQGPLWGIDATLYALLAVLFSGLPVWRGLLRGWGAFLKALAWRSANRL